MASRYMAHLSLKDWRAVGDDFVKLQFVAEGSMHPNDVPGLMDSVGVLLDILMSGGGAANLDKLQARTHQWFKVCCGTTHCCWAFPASGFLSVTSCSEWC
jgi:hypothetical protein